MFYTRKRKKTLQKFRGFPLVQISQEQMKFN